MADDILKDLQERLEMPPPAVHARNINIDTHIGDAPHRPYALLEDHLASVTGGFRDVAALKASLKSAPEPEGLPDGAPNPNDVEDDGVDLVRYVPSQEAVEMEIRDGVPHEVVTFEKRYVSLSMEGARIADSPDRPTDSWNGFTWLRGGRKPERDFPVMARAAGAAGPNGPMRFSQPASPSAVATLRHEMNKVNAAQAPLPVQPSRSEPRHAAKSKED